MIKKHDISSISIALSGFQPDRPFNELPPLPPGADIETKAILRKCITAGRALAALQQAAALIPNQDVLINTIPLREAKDSSEIENIVTTNDKLFEFAQVDADQADSATKETLLYRTALLQGYRDIQSRPLTTRTAVEICRIIKATDLDIRRTPGIALRSRPGNRVIYTPPEGEPLLRDKLANWETFLHNDTADPLVRMAVGHYQFEAIHPFPDGNGRTGRVINILYLVEQGLLDLPILYLSRYINENRSEYYRLLLEVTVNQAWESWILFMLDAVEETANWTRAKIAAIKFLMEETVRFVSVKLPKIYKRELVEVLFTQPYCRIGDLVALDLGNRATVSKHLRDLVGAGVLEERKSGRERLFINTKLLDLLTSDENEVAPFR